MHHLIITVTQCQWISMMEWLTQLWFFSTLLWEGWLISQIKRIKRGRTMNHGDEELNYVAARRTSTHKIKRLKGEKASFYHTWNINKAADFLSIVFSISDTWWVTDCCSLSPPQPFNSRKEAESVNGKPQDGCSGRCTARWQRCTSPPHHHGGHGDAQDDMRKPLRASCSGRRPWTPWRAGEEAEVSVAVSERRAVERSPHQQQCSWRVGVAYMDVHTLSTFSPPSRNRFQIWTPNPTEPWFFS